MSARAVITRVKVQSIFIDFINVLICVFHFLIFKVLLNV
jgi:hypothetical protein